MQHCEETIKEQRVQSTGHKREECGGGWDYGTNGTYFVYRFCFCTTQYIKMLGRWNSWSKSEKHWRGSVQMSI